MARGYLGARSQFDLGDEDVPLCDMCDGCGWLLWDTHILDSVRGEAYPVTMFVGCADCNDDQTKPYPTPWPVCLLCEQQTMFCQCGPILIN